MHSCCCACLKACCWNSTAVAGDPCKSMRPPCAYARTQPSTVLFQHHVLVVVLTSGANGTDTLGAKQLTGTCRKRGSLHW
jgi:hypothetical protein